MRQPSLVNKISTLYYSCYLHAMLLQMLLMLH